MSELIRREDVIKTTWQEPSYTDPYNVLTEVRDRINALPAFSPWHRVEDDYPDLLQFVVVCNDDGKCVVAQYVGYQTDSPESWRIAYTMYDTDIYDEKECGPVRYWMPIEPPEWIKDVDDPPELDPCYECGGYGDDYHIDEDGELVSNCPDCPFNKKEGEK